jgi:molecular chaperone GrpE
MDENNHEQEKPAETASAAASEEVERLKMSPELAAALAEAEAHVGVKSAAEAPAEKAEPSGPAAEPAPAFDPNAVETAPAEAPVALPSPEELKLKMQILDLRSQLRGKDKELEQKVQELRLNAEQVRLVQRQFEGYKTRAMKEKADWFNYGHEPVLKELLQVADNLDRALSHAKTDADPATLMEGVSLILRQLTGLLGKFGVSEVAAQDQRFNPEWHQAMVQVEHDEKPANTVLEVHQKGYSLKDRLLRPAMVVVSKKSEAAKEAAPRETGTPASTGSEEGKRGSN